MLLSCEMVLELMQESGFPGLLWGFWGLFAGSCRVLSSIPFLFWLFLERLTFLPHLSAFFLLIPLPFVGIACQARFLCWLWLLWSPLPSLPPLPSPSFPAHSLLERTFS